MDDRESMNLALKPDWMMVGGPGPRGCRLIASAKLTRGEIRTKYGFTDVYGASYPPVRIDTDVAVVCHCYPPDMVIIDGPDYQACLAELWRVWSPEHGKAPAPSGVTQGGQRDLHPVLDVQSGTAATP